LLGVYEAALVQVLSQVESRGRPGFETCSLLFFLGNARWCGFDSWSGSRFFLV